MEKAMNKRIVLLILPMLLTFKTFDLPAFALDEDTSLKSLRGVKELAIVIEGIPNFLEKELKKEIVRKDIQNKLQIVGIKVLADKDASALNKPLMHVAMLIEPRGVVNTPGEERCSFYISVSIQQVVVLERDASIRFFSASWSSAERGAGRSGEDVRYVIKDLVDKFLTAYVSVNPK